MTLAYQGTVTPNTGFQKPPDVGFQDQAPLASRRGMLAFWMGGAATVGPVVPVGGGYRSMLHPWLGGAYIGVAAPTPVGGGYPSLMGFWMGGHVGAGSPPIVAGGSGVYIPRFRRRTR